MAQYRIPKSITTEMRMYKHVYLTDLVFLIGLILFGWLMNSFVHDSRMWLFYGFLLFIGGVFLIRPNTNPKKRVYEALLIAIKRKKDTYVAIDYVVDDDEELNGGDEINGNSKRK
ncbi:DUF5592 family protein [Shouchella sp. 1P09AA]|uniref:DUF5592 family protein n=1 Tax=unclassified Shouchella TaxID=2893065 RepID=UPI0039A29EBB